MKHDIILRQMKLVHYIQDPNTIKLVLDEKFKTILDLLVNPLTMEDIIDHYKKYALSKSEKTIYRYLLKLKRAGLIIEAGKRVYEEVDDQLRNSPLYTRSAYIFSFNNKKQDLKNSTSNDLIIIKNLLCKYLNHSEDISTEQMKKKIDLVYSRKKELIENLAQDIIDKFPDDLEYSDWASKYYILDFVSWLLISQEISNYFDLK